MKPSLDHRTFRSISVHIVVILIALTGSMIIGLEVMSLWSDSSVVHQQFSLNQKTQLDLLESELESEIRHLVQIFPAFVKSRELLKRITEVTLAGPYFVYSPQYYGQPIDYWDRVQILKRQIWMVNYFMPLLQSQQLDYLGIFLYDPHNNLIRNSIVPFLELEPARVSFYSYPIKGLFHQLGKHTQSQIDKIIFSEAYFDQVIYNIGEKDTLYSALGFNESIIPVPGAPSNRFMNHQKIRVDIANKRLILERAITLKEDIYNWKAKIRESTEIVTLVAQKQLDSDYLVRIREKFGSDELALVTDSQESVASLTNLDLTFMENQGKTEVDSIVYRYLGRAYQNALLENKIQLYVLTKESQVGLQPVGSYKSIAMTATITLLLGLMVWFYFTSTLPSANQTHDKAEVDVHWNNPAHSLVSDHHGEIKKEKYLLIEDKGKSQTIQLKDVSHIRVTDHYCTIFYLQEGQWKNWMIMERLKTFEIRYQQLLLKINRSTLINPKRIDKIQLLQRKLTMQGEPEFLFTISQSSLETVKSILASRPHQEI